MANCDECIYHRVLYNHCCPEASIHYCDLRRPAFQTEGACTEYANGYCPNCGEPLIYETGTLEASGSTRDVMTADCPECKAHAVFDLRRDG